MAEADRSPSSGRILVIDDDPTILELIKEVLIEEGYEVEAVLNGYEALDSTVPGPPALIVLDMLLPGPSGVELVDALRAKHGHDVPILITSASNVEEEAQALGAYEYVAKPFDLDQLTAAVRRGLPPSSR